jgi:hypothetical protein
MSAGRRCLLGIAALFLLASGARAQFVATVISSNLYEPNGVATGADGNVYITDSSNNRLLQFKPSSGELTLFAGVSNRFSPGTNNGVGPFAKFNHPTGIVATAGGLIVVDQGNQELRFVSYAGGVTNFAGIAGVTGTNNGPGATATFNYPTGIAADGLGNYYVADQNNNLIRKIDSNTNVTTIAATNVATGKIYQFSTPTGVAVDNNGNIWVSDTGNNVISMISNQTVTVVAGTFGMSGFYDSITATDALFAEPSGILWVASTGNLLISDTGNNVIRNLLYTNSYGTIGYAVETVAGTPGVRGLVDGPPGTAEFMSPAGLGVDIYDSGFYVVDSAANALRVFQPNAPQAAVAAPEIGYVTFPPPGGTSVFNQSTGATFNSLVTIAIAAEGATQTYITYGPTGSLIPRPGAGSTQPPLYPGDGSDPANVSAAITRLPGTNDVTIYAIGESSGRSSSPVVSARYQFVTGNPIITGDNPANILLTDITPGANLYYTIDGTTPTNDGSSGVSVASGTTLNLNITNNVVLQVRGFATGLAPSTVSSNNLSVSNVVGDQLTWGFQSGPVSTHFITALNLQFTAPVTFTELPASLPIYTLQFNLTVTNNGPTLAPVAHFESDLLQEIPNTTPVLWEELPPSILLNGVTNPGVLTTQPDTTEVAWLVVPPVTNLYLTPSYELMYLSAAAQRAFYLDLDGGLAVLGTLSFVVPAGAAPGNPYTLQISYPSASSFDAPACCGLPIDVFIQAPTNGPTNGTGLNAVKAITVLSNNAPASAHLVGDVFPFNWYNIGDFGNAVLLDDDVIQTMECAGKAGFDNNPYYDAMDSSDGSVNNYYTASEAAINLITNGDGQINVDDVYVTLLRSLDPRLNNYNRIWSGTKWMPVLYPKPVQLSAKAALPPLPPSKMALSGPRYVSVAAGQVQASNLTAQVPISVVAADSLPVSILMFNVEVDPLEGSPPITSAIGFSPVANLGAPWAIISQAPNNYTAAWLSTNAAGVSGTNLIGTLTIPLPACATSNSSYRVHFNHFSASPNGLALFHLTAQDGLVTVGNRTGSSWHDGIPDTWRLLYFGAVSNALSAANADPDGDGASNWEEYVAGTNPLDATSVFKLLPSSAPAAGFFTLQWPSVVNKSYTVQSSTSSLGGWTTLATNLSGNGQTLQWTDPNPATVARFYRVLVQ